MAFKQQARPIYHLQRERHHLVFIFDNGGELSSKCCVIGGADAQLTATTVKRAVHFNDAELGGNDDVGRGRVSELAEPTGADLLDMALDERAAVGIVGW